ncbi:hypothetical protein M8J75_005113 [Diaphorina citri]|nr:hypothetical protein M8J75_005113 [Diaphorina citri]KAI5708254.1 hypothetical protein M8J77_019225 [Diaphorina citri]
MATLGQEIPDAVAATKVNVEDASQPNSSPSVEVATPAVLTKVNAFVLARLIESIQTNLTSGVEVKPNLGYIFSKDPSGIL